MSIETKCQTPGAVFETRISDASVSVEVTLPFPLNLTEAQAQLLEASLHNAMELVLAQHFVPKYQHDCSRCDFLGSYTYDAPLVKGTEEITVDLWFCGGADAFMGGSLIARASGDGPDYSSAPVEIVERDYLPRAERGEKQCTLGPAIVEAHRRLKRQT